MTLHEQAGECAGYRQLSRRVFQQAALGTALSWGWLTPLAESLARAAERSAQRSRPRSVIVLWLQGGPSQLDTFDPQPESPLGAGVRARQTAVRGIRLAEGFEQLAEQMPSVALVRAVVSKEGDHERATYNAKTGFRPVPALTHPALGSVLCHQLSDDVEIPRHVSILPGAWPARGGYLGDAFDAFQIGDPAQPIPDVQPRVSQERFARRLEDLLNVVEPEFARGRLPDLDRAKTLHASSMRAATRMMDSEQLQAFDIGREPIAVRREYGETPFGRGCLAAARLIEVGVRCVEVTLDGWDSHVNNLELQRRQVDILDPALAALVRDLRRRDLLEQTVVLCGGEFGRTPRVNRLEGRDHWPHGFSVALAGGGIRGGQVWGATSPEIGSEAPEAYRHLQNPCTIADLHGTIYAALGVDFRRELTTPIGRPMKICDGEPIRELLRT